MFEEAQNRFSSRDESAIRRLEPNKKLLLTNLALGKRTGSSLAGAHGRVDLRWSWNYQILSLGRVRSFPFLLGHGSGCQLSGDGPRLCKKGYFSLKCA